MRGIWWMVVVAMVAATAAQADPPVESPQAIYDAAQAAFDRSDWTAAIAGFRRVARPAQRGRVSPAQASIRSRLALALARSGQFAEARLSARIAIDALTGQKSSDLATAWLALGDADRFDLELRTALADYEQAIATSPPGDLAEVRRLANLAITMVATTVDPERAAAAADALITDRALMASLDREVRAQYNMIRARAELNRGHLSDALRYVREAVSQSGGGETRRINLVQVAIRADAAIAFQLNHDEENTRKFITFTGAGHNGGQQWISGDVMDPPTCGADLQPDDTAVIDFAISEDGHVVEAQPIYASRAGDVGTLFARAVRGWHWSPDAVHAIDPFWRASIRVQLRCIMRPAPTALDDEFLQFTQHWLDEQGAVQDDVALLQRRDIAPDDPRLGGTDRAALAALMVRRFQLGAPDADIDGRLDRALDATAAPAEVRALVIFKRVPRQKSATLRSWAIARVRWFTAQLPAFETRFPGSRAAAWLRLELAIATEQTLDLRTARPFLETIAALPPAALNATDPIRRIAVLHLAALDAHDGKADVAQQRLISAGIDHESCSLIDTRPVAENESISSGQFPTEALRWGFDGFVRSAFDIAADGSVTNVRSVIAYPPFIFDEGTSRAVSRFHYLAPALSGAPLGCDGQTVNVRYHSPR